MHLSRIRFYTRVDDGTIVTCGFGRNQAGRGCRSGNLEPIPEFLIGTSDGDPAKEGTRPFSPRYHQRVGPGERYDFDVVHEGQGRDLVDLSFPSIPTQRLLFKISGQQGVEWEIAEFEIYASGYAPTARYTSNVIDLGEEFSLGDLTWTGQQGSDPETRVDITMRSGDDEHPNVYWRPNLSRRRAGPFFEQGRSTDARRLQPAGAAREGGHPPRQRELGDLERRLRLFGSEAGAPMPTARGATSSSMSRSCRPRSLADRCSTCNSPPLLP